MIKTYYVTQTAGEVRRLDDFTVPWVDVSVGAATNYFNDVMAFPDDPEKVIVVGLDNQIFKTIDSGVTWTPAVGTYTGLAGTNEFYEVWIVDDLISYAGCNNGQVVKSIDGGVTYDLTPNFPTSDGKLDPDFKVTAIHFIDSLIGIVGLTAVSGATYVWKTTDGGATWSILNGGFELDFSPLIGGVHLSADQQVINAVTSDKIYRSTDAGVTFIPVQTLDTFIADAGIHLTWASDDVLWATGLGDQMWQSVDAGATWSVIRNYNAAGATIFGAHFYSTTEGYLGGQDGLSIFETADAGVNTLLSETLGVVMSVWTELGAFSPCYMLVDCAGVADPIYTAIDLADQVGQVITLADTDGSELEGCWQVVLNPTPCVDPTEVSVYRCYTECADCLPEPDPITVPNPRAVHPEFDTGTCDPALVEKAFCAYGELMYQKMMEHRFKIANCCPKDEGKILLNFKLMQLNLLKDADPTPDECNPVCNAYSVVIQAVDVALITYTDCDGVEQTIQTSGISEDQTVLFCALDTTAPIVVITHPDLTTDTYTLQPTGVDCNCASFTILVEQEQPGTIDYVDCNGIGQQLTNPDVITQTSYIICADRREAIVFSSGITDYTITDNGPCE